MNRRTFLRLPAALLVATHATILLSGPCLHASPARRQPGTVPPLAQGVQALDHVRGWHDEHHCPICQFLSQGQLPIGAAEVERSALTHFRPLDLRPAIFLGPLGGSFRSRAPPLVRCELTSRTRP